MGYRGVFMNEIVESVSDFIKFVGDIPPQLGHQPLLKAGRFFRGQSKFEWSLSPSLYREGLFLHEKVLINETIHKLPDEFKKLDKFAALVKMQHYGMKTRLLDLTENPLVALYFAVNSHPDSDGALFIINNGVTHYSDDMLLKLSMEYIFNYSGYPLDLEEAVIKLRHSLRNFHGRRLIQSYEDLLYDLTIDAFCVTPKMNNKRLIAQQGAFLCFGMQLDEIQTSDNIGTFGKRYAVFKPTEITNQETLKVGGNLYKLRIPYESKKTILKELKILNIHQASLFLDIDHQLNFIYETIKQENYSC